MARLDAEENDEIDRLLLVASRRQADLDVRIVLTVRDDSIDSTLERLHRAGIHQDMVRSFRLHRMPHARFTEIINGPAAAARRANYPLDLSDELSIALASAASENLGRIGDALPILALALQRLVKKHRAPDGRVTLKPDMAERFISEAVSDAANDALTATGCETSHLRRLIIPHLVTRDPRAGEGGAAKRQVASAETLFRAGSAPLNGLADELVNQRLLTKTSSKDGALYEVSHEALLRAVPLGDLIKGLREKFLRADVLKLELQEWKDSGRKVERLARAGERLREAQVLLEDEDFGGDLSNPDLALVDYLDACSAKEREDSEWRELAEKYRAAGLESARRRVEARSASNISQENPASRLNVYITHSRRDAHAAERLADDLRNAGINPVLDVQSIAEAEDWKRRLHQLIRQADSVVFLVSRSSVDSQVCAWEIDEAVQLQKRILPVVVERLEVATWPASIRNLNAIFMTSEDEWIFGLDSLISALSTDLEWIREHTRLGELAARWQEREHSLDLLLRGAELDAARAWSRRRPMQAPDLTSVQIAFLNESARNEADRQDVERRKFEEMEAAQEARAAALEQAEQARRRTSRRTRIGLVAALGFAMFASAAAAYAYLQREIALQQRDMAEVAEAAARQAQQEVETATVRANTAEKERVELAETQKALVEQGNTVPSRGPGDAAFLSGQLNVEMIADGRTVRVTREMVFRDSSGTRWVVPAGAEVDGSSIPQSLWSVVGSPFDGALRSASVLHDYYSQTRQRPWQDVNRMFFEAMLASGVPAEKARLVFLATQLFGPKWSQ
jgi:hypothetical protein